MYNMLWTNSYFRFWANSISFSLEYKRNRRAKLNLKSINFRGDNKFREILV